MSDTVEAHVVAVRAAVDAELAKLAFRAEPSWDDLHAAIAAVVRYILGGPPPVAVDPVPVEADPVAERPTAEIIPLVVPVDPEKQIETGETIDTSGTTPPTDQPPPAA